MPNLINTIKEDCILWMHLYNNDKLLHSYMYLDECKYSAENGLYQLILNGNQLWYGTLQEINAIVKSMIIRLEKDDFLYE